MSSSDPSDAAARNITAPAVSRFQQLCGATEERDIELLLPRLCEAATAVLAVDAMGISVMLEDEMRMPLGASSQAATTAEQTEFTLGEGPCLHAYTAGRPILVPDVEDRASMAWSAWPSYASALLERTLFKAVFALPLTARGMSLGTVSMYRTTPGPISPDDLGDALAVTTEIFDYLLATNTFSGQAQPAFRWLDLPAAKTRTVVWQALGMATIELGLNPPDALALLRSYSFGHNRLMDDVAADVVSGILRLDELHP